MLYKIEQKDGKYQHTSKSIKEIIKCIEDKQYFFKRYVKILTPQDGIIPFIPNNAQEKTLNELNQHNKNICVVPRQTGMTTLIAANCLHDLLFKENNTTIYVATKFNSVYHFTDILKLMISHLPDCLYENSSISKHEIKIDSNRLIGTSVSSDSVKGICTKNIVFDNISWSTIKSIEECHLKVWPCLSSMKEPNILFVDTPPQDYFIKLEPFLIDDSFNRFNITVNDIERFNDSQVKKDIISSIGLKRWKQEYEICWGFNK